jgi:hypothetical protein
MSGRQRLRSVSALTTEEVVNRMRRASIGATILVGITAAAAGAQ